MATVQHISPQQALTKTALKKLPKVRASSVCMISVTIGVTVYREAQMDADVGGVHLNADC